ncbi:MAG: hypothetical protein U0Q22_17440 [Acidimicrobiales bacterium]
MAMRERYRMELLPSLTDMRATFAGPPIGLWDFANFRGSLEVADAFPERAFSVHDEFDESIGGDPQGAVTFFTIR